MLIVLFMLLLLFTLLDITMSGIALRYGGREVGVLFLISGDFQLTSFIKGVTSTLVGLVLVAYRRRDLLLVANGFMFLLTIYHGIMLLRTIGG